MVKRSVKKWTCHKEAKCFKAPARNVQLPAIRSTYDQERERQFAAMQNMIGAQAAISLELWDCIARLREQQVQLITARQALKAKDGSDQMMPPEQAISQISDDAKESRAIIESEISVGMKDSLRISAALFNQTTLLRRKIAIKGMADSKGTKERLEECQPSSEFLFGADLGELAKAIRNEAQFKGKSFPEKRSFFQKKSGSGGQSNQGKSGQGKSSTPKSAFSKGKKTFKKKN